MQISKRTEQILASLTIAVDTKAKSMLANGMDVVNFTVGEPDFDTPIHIKEAAKLALNNGKTKYGATEGEVLLREAIVKKFVRDNKLNYSTKNIMITNGGKHSLYEIMMATINEGDEVIVPTPYWLSYTEMIKLAGGVPVIVNTTEQDKYKITPNILEKVITNKTKMFILNSPSNPTGSVYSVEELQNIAKVISKYDIYVLSDEIYEKLIYDCSVKSIATLSDEMFNKTIISNGFSKTYAMTGWRIGYIVASEEIIKAAVKIQSHTTSNVCTFAQYGAIAALEASQDCVEEMRQKFYQRRNLMYDLVSGIDRISCLKPDGAFYLFINITKTGLKSLDFCNNLLEQELVAAVPGIVFGMDDCVRLSYTTNSSNIIKGIERLNKFVQNVIK